MRKSRLTMTTFAVALFLGAFANAQTQFRDIPAGHWARQAVEFAVQCGLIEGFPDGTFRGNQNLTRYQAALIFFRLYQTNRLETTRPECRLAVERGAQEVAPELEQLRQRFAALERTNQDQAARLAALEAEVKRAIETSQRAAALEQRLAALEQQVQRLAQAPQPTQPAQPAGPTPAELQARIAALEQQVQRLSQAPAAPSAPQDAVALERRIATLEEQVRNRPDAARVAALEEQVRGLSGQVTTLQNQVNELRQQAQRPAPAPQPQPQPEVRPTPPATPPAPAGRNLYFGAGAALGILPQPPGGIFNTNNLAISGVVGVREVFLGFGLRAGLDYNLGTQALGIEAYLTRHFGTGFLNPYVGVGARFLPALANPVYGSAAVGLDINAFGPLGFFVEANPRLEAGLNFGLGARAGLKFNF
ncbi:MAG: S-layer homology domain-containing protein [Meiothermus sp.]|uniref:S-layer homology domain-containing protein n=1 Tax=Meiothermus sp. TaxID=1955249 RepID=UPI0025F51DC2|nr:S-layer homology domain-containing protein [Meiothermus sp.]MCS7067965.1 S-layer homology domain-containing protein [Meiothermus sp.]MDW8425573.1 S-layer homology domain-containing protein [Meiothermus sp.]